MKKFKIALLLLAVFTGSSPAQVLTLDSVLARIERNNPMLKMYDEQINAINNSSQMAKSWMPPSLSTGPWQVPYKDFQGGMWMITGEQMIPNPVKQKANFNYMKGMTPVEQHGKEAKQNEMFAMAKQNYYQWVVQQKKYNVLKHSKLVFQRTYPSRARQQARSRRRRDRTRLQTTAPQRRSPSSSEMPNQYSAMGMITIPIAPWSSKEYKSNIKGLDNTTKAINYEKQSLINETVGMIVSLQTQIKSTKQQLANYSDNISSCSISLYY